MRAIKSVLLTCDPAVKEILIAMNERDNFIIEDLDDWHLVIKADEEFRVRRELEVERPDILLQMQDSLELDRALVAETNARIREIEAEISKLQVEEQVTALKDSISVLHASKEPAQQRLDSYKYPVLTLPNELIAEFFLHFLPTYPEPPLLFGELSPTTLTHTCRQWQEIALTTPALWRAIDLRGSTVETAAGLAPLWLERSGRLPLSIRAADSVFKDFLSVYRFFIPHRARWEHLDLRLDDPKHLDVLDGPLPLLLTLSVYLRRGFVNPLLLQTLPLLRTVILDDSGRPSLILPWSQMTCLTLRSLYPAECISILRQTENLVSCNLDPWTEKLPKGRLVDVQLLRLETLVFERGRCDVWVEFLQLLITPALRSLEIAEELLGSTDPIGTLEPFISKSGCTLNELRIITTAYLPKVDYRKAFPSIPIVRYM
ncbi:F-box domain-containing protein [Favolaschia claudopus]|uniref:RNA polymerase II transcription factor B subunit 5 n=1 Tax=Favolaschia claudopus TaxID=2862362 RepID=A0AAW0DM54_9AGAR